MVKIGIIGHYGFGHECLDGQTIKTKIITEQLEKHLGADQVYKADTHGRFSYLPKIPFQVWSVLRRCETVIIMPAYKGIRLITPILCLFNWLFRRKLTYIVVGGWIPEKTRQDPVLRALLKSFHGLYVETPSMEQKLRLQGFRNVWVMPNCKPLPILQSSELTDFSTWDAAQPLPLCMFSRVMKEKGVGEAAEAVHRANVALGRTAYRLDVYGQIWRGQEDWFESLRKQYDESEFHYGGFIPFDQSVSTLRSYFAMLFPTYYRGECFAGTFLDALASGVPILASDWHDNAQLVKEGKTGRLFPVHDVEGLASMLIDYAMHPETLQSMREVCITEARCYRPEEVIHVFLQSIGK